MATIIALTLRQDRPERPASSRPRPLAGEVVIFPGVRYERASTAAGDALASSRRKRDVLLIPE